MTVNDTRRITPSDEAFLRRFRAEMKFDHAGPLVTLLDPIRPVKPWRDLTGKVDAKQPRYSATSAESYSIGSALAQQKISFSAARGVPGIVVSALDLLVQKFGREYGSVLDDETAPVAPKRRRGRRGGRGRKPVAS